jgi:uncharacterized protein (UPF0335 family)
MTTLQRVISNMRSVGNSVTLEEFIEYVERFEIPEEKRQLMQAFSDGFKVISTGPTPEQYYNSIANDRREDTSQEDKGA